MLNLLTTVVGVFGNDKSWNSGATIFWLVYIQIAIIVVAATIAAYLILQRKAKRAGETVVVADAQPATAQNTEVIYVHEPAVEEERMLTGITLDLGVVQREFTAGDEFDCNGLVVNAEFNVMPTTESIVDYTLIDKDTYVKLERRDKLHGVYVIKPKMHTVGIKVVTVKYLDQTSAYTISVNEHKTEEIPEPVEQVVAEPATVVEEHVVEQPVVVEHVVEKPVIVERVVERPVIIERVVEKPVIVEHVVEVPVEVEADEEQHVVSALEAAINDEESVQAGTLRYDKSFTARVIQSDDEVKHWYTEIKNELLSYKGVKGRISWKRETFKCGGKLVLAKLAYRGKRLCLFLPLNVADYMEEYTIEDSSDMSCYEDTPLMVRFKNPKRVEVAKELIRIVMEQHGIVRVPHESVDYYLPYEGIVELIKKGLIKRDIRSAKDEAIFERSKTSDDE